jgi:hypothetical protein
VFLAKGDPLRQPPRQKHPHQPQPGTCRAARPTCPSRHVRPSFHFNAIHCSASMMLWTGPMLALPPACRPLDSRHSCQTTLRLAPLCRPCQSLPVPAILCPGCSLCCRGGGLCHVSPWPCKPSLLVTPGCPLYPLRRTHGRMLPNCSYSSLAAPRPGLALDSFLPTLYCPPSFHPPSPMSEYPSCFTRDQHPLAPLAPLAPCLPIHFSPFAYVTSACACSAR